MIEISGKVIHGAKYGRQLGFPTANIDRREYVRRKMKVRLGVWAGVVQALGLPKSAGHGPSLHRKQHKAAIVVGPLDKHQLPKIEAHLIGFKGNLYGKKITISLQKYIRPFKKFKSEIELRKQIALDIKLIKSL